MFCWAENIETFYILAKKCRRKLNSNARERESESVVPLKIDSPPFFKVRMEHLSHIDVGKNIKTTYNSQGHRYAHKGTLMAECLA